MRRPSRRGGRAGLQPAQRQAKRVRACCARPIDGASPTRPAGVRASPTWITPRRKVPVVSTTARAGEVAAVAGDDAGDAPPGRGSGLRPRRPAKVQVRAARPAAPAWPRGRAPRSIWARGPRTAGPLLRLSSGSGCRRASAARPIRPSRASISRTRWPLPRPPIAGLQDISPMRVEPVGQQQGARADARRGGGGFAAGVAAADDDDVES